MENCLQQQTIFQICVNGCNQNGCFHRRDYGTPLRNFTEASSAKSAKQAQAVNKLRDVTLIDTNLSVNQVLRIISYHIF